MTGGGAGSGPAGGAGTGPGREADDPEGPQPALDEPVLREAIAAAKADEPDILRELADIATEPEWPHTDRT